MAGFHSEFTSASSPTWRIRDNLFLSKQILGCDKTFILQDYSYEERIYVSCQISNPSNRSKTPPFFQQALNNTCRPETHFIPESPRIILNARFIGKPGLPYLNSPCRATSVTLKIPRPPAKERVRSAGGAVESRASSRPKVDSRKSS